MALKITNEIPTSGGMTSNAYVKVCNVKYEIGDSYSLRATTASAGTLRALIKLYLSEDAYIKNESTVISDKVPFNYTF